MWIKEMPKVLGESGSINVNFLYKKNKIYVSDNHLAAAWCWLQEIDVLQKYTFVHIDRHYDLIDQPEEIEANIVERNIDVQNLNFEEYCGLKQDMEGPPDLIVKLFRWDNYIHHIDNLFPNLFGNKYFVTKKAGSKTEFVEDEYDIEHFLREFKHWIEYPKNGCIVNLDLDYFFASVGGPQIQLYSDEAIKKVAEEIKKRMAEIDVLTIALSPECCGGWENSFKILKIFNEILELKLDEIINDHSL
ncbi:hypothetical protein IO90_10510 [Chryseobacterium sp. FH1]|nr:hypothetical protein IO90_10510 [Chryseobacterium sp. FH1]